MTKIRESGMPEAAIWEQYFDPGRVLTALRCDRISGDALEFGCGYGTFSIPAAQRVSGVVHALDIDPEMVAATQERARREGLLNVRAEQRDFLTRGSGLTAGSVGYAIAFNILHGEDPHTLLREAYRVLEPGGYLGIIHWRRDLPTPRGPPMEIRPDPQVCRRWAEAAGLNFVDAPKLADAPWHWGLCFSR